MSADILRQEFEDAADKAKKALYPQDSVEPIVGYHYATRSGFRGIVEQREIWATHASYLNDPGEMQYALDVIDESADQGFLSKLQHPVEIFQVLRILRRDADERRFAIFIAAFSEHSDSLGQWRAYGENGGGYAIGLEIELGDSPFGFEPAMAIGLTPPAALRCIYDRKKQLDAVRPFRELLVKLDVMMADRHHDAEHLLQAAIPALLRLAVHYSIVLKHPAYEEEKEVRLIALAREESAAGCVRFRESSHGLAPYVVIPLVKGDKKVPIKEVVTGPKQSHGAVAGTRLYLASNFYADFQVRPSATPFR